MMKQKNLLWLFAVTLLASQIPSLTFNIKPASARITVFDCVQMGSQWATIARVVDSSGNTIRKTTPLITWKSRFFQRPSGSGYTPRKRCGLVSSELTEVAARHGGRLNNVHLTHDRINGYAVICYVEQDLGICTQDSVLLTLSPNNARNPRQVLEDLVEFSQYGRGNPIEETGGRIYVNLGDLIQAASTNSNTSSNTPENPEIDNSPPSTLPPRPSNPNPTGGGGSL